MTHPDPAEQNLARVFGPLGAPLLEPQNRVGASVPLPDGDGFSEDWDDDGCECGSGCEQCDPAHHASHHTKWIAEGLTTLAEVVDAAQAQTDHLRALLAAGWVLDQPVDNGHMWLRLPVSASIRAQVS